MARLGFLFLTLAAAGAAFGLPQVAGLEFAAGRHLSEAALGLSAAAFCLSWVATRDRRPLR